MTKKILGYTFALLGCFFGVLSGISVKWIDHEIPTLELLFFRFLIGFVIMLPIVIKKEGPLKLSSTPWGKHILRAFLGMLAVFSCYYAIPKVNFTDYVILGRVYPIFMIGLSLFFLKEKATFDKILAAFLAVIGAAIAIKPSLESPPIFLLLILFGVFVASLSDIVVKKLTVTQSCEKIVLCFFGIAAFSLAFCMPFVWVTPMNMNYILIIISIGITGLLSQYFVTKAYSTLNAGTVGVISSSQLIWAVLFGVSLWNETIELHVWIGMFVIFLSSFVVQNLKYNFFIKKRYKRLIMPLVGWSYNPRL